MYKTYNIKVLMVFEQERKQESHKHILLVRLKYMGKVINFGFYSNKIRKKVFNIFFLLCDALPTNTCQIQFPLTHFRLKVLTIFISSHKFMTPEMSLLRSITHINRCSILGSSPFIHKKLQLLNIYIVVSIFICAT